MKMLVGWVSKGGIHTKIVKLVVVYEKKQNYVVMSMVSLLKCSTVGMSQLSTPTR